MTGCKKILQNEERKWPQPKIWADGIRQNLEFYLHHYQYLEETRKIRRKTIVILVPCDNCNEHKIDPKHCDLILNANSDVQGIALKITVAVETFYIVKNNLLSYVLHQEYYQHQLHYSTFQQRKILSNL